MALSSIPAPSNGFRMRWQGVWLISLDRGWTPGIHRKLPFGVFLCQVTYRQFGGTRLLSWAEKCTVNVKLLDQEHNTTGHKPWFQFASLELESNLKTYRLLHTSGFRCFNLRCKFFFSFISITTHSFLLTLQTFQCLQRTFWFLQSLHTKNNSNKVITHYKI